MPHISLNYVIVYLEITQKYISPSVACTSTYYCSYNSGSLRGQYDLSRGQVKFLKGHKEMIKTGEQQ